MKEILYLKMKDKQAIKPYYKVKIFKCQKKIKSKFESLSNN